MNVGPPKRKRHPARDGVGPLLGGTGSRFSYTASIARANIVEADHG